MHRARQSTFDFRPSGRETAKAFTRARSRVARILSRSLPVLLLLSAPAGAQTLRGKVVLQGWEEPSPGARVLLLDSLLSPVDSTLADALGRFRLDLPASGRFAVQAVQGSAQSSVAGSFEAGVPPPAELLLELPSPLFVLAGGCRGIGPDSPVGTLVGVIYEASTRVSVPRGRVQVQFTAPDGSPVVHEVVADERGHYRICALPPQTPLRLWAMGMGRTSPPIDDLRVEAGALHRADLSIGSAGAAGAAYTSIEVTASRRIGGLTEPGVLRGRLLDASTGQPIGTASVALGDGGFQTLTDSAGRFSFRDVPSAVHSLRIEQPGYGEQRTPVELAGGAELEIEVRLAAAPIELPGIEADARRAVLPGLSASSSRVITGSRMAEFENRGAYLSDIVTWLPVRVTRRGPRVCFESRRGVGTLGGGGGCAMVAVFVDDVEVFDPGSYIDQIRARELETVIYLSPMEAGYRFGLQAAGSGALLIYTRGRGPFRLPERDSGG